MAPKPEANETDLFGKYLFSPERKHDTGEAVPVEKNTEAEEQTKKELADHYTGSMEMLKPLTVQKLFKLRKGNKYLKLLAVPSKYQFAYRLVTFFDKKQLQAFLKDQEAGLSGGPKTINVQAFGGRSHSSWSVDPAVFMKDRFSKDLQIGCDAVIVLLRASVEENNFILNPDVFSKLTSITHGYGYQREILSVGGIKNVTAIWATCKTIGPAGNPVTTIKGLVAAMSKL